MSNQPKISINLVVLNGGKYIRHCLDSILAQTYPHELIEINILDNGSSDNTVKMIENSKFKIQNSKFSRFNFVQSKINLGVWPGQEELLKYSDGKYILALSVDIILDKDFLKNSVNVFENDEKIGAVEPKIYKFNIRSDIQNSKFVIPNSKIIDTCGFKIFKSRRIINIGHGEKDNGRFNKQEVIFAVEGAAPILRREAIENCHINGKFIDHNYFWYGDDLDWAWRMTLFGWKQVYDPNMVAWHDRQTTKKLSGGWLNFIKLRREIPMKKRVLDWQNVRFTIIKNDYIINILKDLPWILLREIPLFGYIILFETAALLKLPRFIRLLPVMLRQRKEIMSKAKVSHVEMEKFFNS